MGGTEIADHLPALRREINHLSKVMMRFQTGVMATRLSRAFST